MAVPSSTSEKAVGKRSRKTVTAEESSALRIIRIQRGFTQAELGRRAGMHRNSIRKAEDGTTQEVTAQNATALAKVLKTPVSDLGLRVRAATEARSVRFRKLSPEQRQLVDELLSLPVEDYPFIREALERLRRRRTKKLAKSGGAHK
jgi:transcriptional regulator with XRE-family HTH domain